MGEVVEFRRPDNRPPMSAYAKLMLDRRIEEINATKPITTWIKGTKKDDGVA